MEGRMMLAVLLFATFALASADIKQRTIDPVLYPDCQKYKSCVDRRDQNASDPKDNYPNLVYIRAINEQEEDILHYVMTTINLPSVLLVHTVGSKDTKLNFDWDRLLGANNQTDLAGAINATGKGDITYTYTLVMSRLVEYNDINDKADLTQINQTDASLWKIRDFTQFMWMNVTLGEDKKSFVFNTTFPKPKPFQNNTSGSLSLRFEINGVDGRDSDLPRLIYTANNTQFDLALDGYIPTFNKSRFAIEMSVVAQTSSKAMEVEETESIDDEYSPGVFRLVQWYTRGDGGDVGYIQWKPVCYLAAARARDVGTELMYYPLQPPTKVKGLEDLIGQSLARAYYGQHLNDSARVNQMSTNVSFGLSEDGFYVKNNYTVWTASVGYGSAPIDSISTMVIIIIAAGLGLPVVIIIFGGLFVCIRKSRRGSGYQKIDDGVTNSYPNLN